MKVDVSFFDANPVRLASRASQLAMVQAEIVCTALQPAAVTVRPVTSEGDRILDRPLVEAGGKGLFIKELERSILAGESDAAVHSMKDMETHFAASTEIGAVMVREDRRDALVGPYQSLDDLPKGARIGTASVRRAAILLHYRPDLEINLIRGNLNRRLGLLAAGDYDALILAVAGIKRLGVDIAYTPIDAEIMPSAVAQGALAIQIAAADTPRAMAVKNLVSTLTCPTALVEVTAERALLSFLDGSCQTPISASAVLDATGHVTLDGMILRPDGSAAHRKQMRAPADQAETLGAELGAELIGLAGGRDFLV
ncbi:MAG: hydroxymethylbilane synthase [Candidatus Puniceispirillaceae bacterium]